MLGSHGTCPSTYLWNTCVCFCYFPFSFLWRRERETESGFQARGALRGKSESRRYLGDGGRTPLIQQCVYMCRDRVVAEWWFFQVELIWTSSSSVFQVCTSVSTSTQRTSRSSLGQRKPSLDTQSSNTSQEDASGENPVPYNHQIQKPVCAGL